MSKVETLKKLKFENTTQLIAYLQNSGLGWKADRNPERIYVFDNSKARNQSTEFVIKEAKGGNLYLSEVV